jgi:biopolymer transport protein ExbD
MKLQRRAQDAPLPYVPLADLVFNLVLYFVILAKSQQDDVLWERAPSPGTREVAGSRVSVTVDTDNKIYLNGRQVGVRDIAGQLGTLLGESPSDKRVVLLKIHKETLAATFEPILEAVSQAGGEVVHVLQDDR